MTENTTTQIHQTTGSQPDSDWQQACMMATVELGVSWCDFLGQRFQAYAHMLDDVSHCHDLNDAWTVQTMFGQQTLKAYQAQAAKFSDLMMQAATGEGASGRL